MRRLATSLSFVLMLGFPVLALAGSITLKNEDSERYDYEVDCTGTTSSSFIGGNTQTTLGSSSAGCTLKVEGAGSAELSEDSECVIEDGSLSCS